MKFLIVLAFALLVTLGIVPPGADRAEAQSRSKTECTVREGVEFYRQRNCGQALRCWEETAHTAILPLSPILRACTRLERVYPTTRWKPING